MSQKSSTSSNASADNSHVYTEEHARQLDEFGKSARIVAIDPTTEVGKAIRSTHFQDGTKGQLRSPSALIVVQANKPSDVLIRSITPLDKIKDNEAHDDFVNKPYESEVSTNPEDTGWTITHIKGEKAFPLNDKGGKRTRKQKRKRRNKAKTNKRRRRVSKRFRRK